MAGDDTYFKQPGRGMENYGAISSPTTPTGSGNGTPIGSGIQQTCPTCRGTGFVHPDQEHELVALIPLRDKRLKPRRTVCYVCLAVTVCAIVGALLMFFLLPRTVEVSSRVKSLIPMSTNISVLHQYVQLNLRNEYNITNQNFFPITITKMEVRVLFDGKVMSDTTNTTILNVNLRSTSLYSIDFNITFTEDTGYLAYFCSRASPFGHSIWMPFQATATTSYYGHSEEATIDFMQAVQCSGVNADPQESPTDMLSLQSKNSRINMYKV